jgi:DNA-binding transcriptional ArsR family regulator
VVVDADIAAPAALIGDPTRATFLVSLCEGNALPASELARRAGVSASSASIQLAKLVKGGLLAVERQGRHRYYRLADPTIAAAIETLSVIAPRRPARSLRDARLGAELHTARTCYDHLAGALGVSLLDALLAQDVLVLDGGAIELAEGGEDRLVRLGLDVEALRRGRRPFARLCLDWSERRHHLAGALGAALAARLLELGWIERTPSSRAVRVTDEGRAGLEREFRLSAEAA